MATRKKSNFWLPGKKSMKERKLGALFPIAAASLVGAPLAAAEPAGQGIARDEVIHYDVNLDELPGAQVREQTGERTAERRCQFRESGTGEPDGRGRVRILTVLSLNPRSCVIEVARAEYALDALPPQLLRNLNNHQHLACSKRALRTSLIRKEPNRANPRFPAPAGMTEAPRQEHGTPSPMMF